MQPYNVRGDRRCPQCGTFPDLPGARHWRACVPKRHWPDWVRDGGAPPSVAVSEYEMPVPATEAARAVACECGWVVPATSKSPVASMRFHRSNSRVHRVEAVTRG